jgi:hypothetical protein
VYSLEHLFGKNMLRACKILDEGGVRRVTGAPSGRSLFLVGSRTFRSPQMFVLLPNYRPIC